MPTHFWSARQLAVSLCAPQGSPSGTGHQSRGDSPQKGFGVAAADGDKRGEADARAAGDAAAVGVGGTVGEAAARDASGAGVAAVGLALGRAAGARSTRQATDDATTRSTARRRMAG